MKIKQLKDDKCIIEDDDYESLNYIIGALKKPYEKKLEREIELIKPIIKQIDFFKHREKLTDLEFEEVAKNIKYE